MRGRAPLVRPRSPSSQSPLPGKEIEENETYETLELEEEEPFLLSKSFLILFLNCFLFSILVTVCTLYFTNHDELSFFLKELQNHISTSIHVGIKGSEATSKQHEAGQPNDSNAKDAIIYTLNIPPQCREKHQQKPEECCRILTNNMKEAFRRDGVIAVRGLLSPEEILALDQSSLKSMNITLTTNLQKGPIRVVGEGGFKGGKQFFSSRHHAVFEPDLVFRTVGLKSLLPQIASELMIAESESSMGTDETKLRSSTDSIRLIRDVFLAKDQDPFICGWHVDDAGFWPTTFPFQGINAWIALDTIPIATGGGFALSVKSHTADWRFEAYKLTGSTFTLPEGGYSDAQDMFDKRGEGTCNIKKSSPALHDKIEESKRIYDVQRGDIILHTRWLFHRTVPIEKDFAKKLNRKKEKVLYRRYSLRYSPSNAILTSGYGTELSTLYNPSLGGKTLDSACDSDGPWYPKCWPHVDEIEFEKMDSMSEKITIAQEKKKERMKEMKPFLQEIGRQHRENMFSNSPHSRKPGAGTTANIMKIKNSEEL